MARLKLKEIDLKQILAKELNLDYHGLFVDRSSSSDTISHLEPLVIKVDQGVKQRGKKGLLKIGVSAGEAIGFINSEPLSPYTSFIAEKKVPHDPSQEHYLSLELVRSGWRVLFNKKGGIDIENHWDTTKEQTLDYNDPQPDFEDKPLNSLVLKLINTCKDYHLSFLELNPFIMDPSLVLLDAAGEIDGDALLLLQKDGINITPISEITSSEEELKVKELDSHTPASLKLKILNPDGSLWMLLSGGGASLVLADEVADLGAGELLANYGEYSGSPSTDDTKEYTLTVLDSLLGSKADRVALVIAGGVANFTDVAKTFKGIIQALDSKKSALTEKNVKVFVRRGGPNQDKGLAIMKNFLEENNLLGKVTGPDYDLPLIIKDALSYVKGDS